MATVFWDSQGVIYIDTRNNAGTASERISDVNSPQLLKFLKTRFEKQTGKIEFDIIAGKVKQMDACVLTLEREVADLRSMRDRIGERVETQNREVANLQAAVESLGALEAAGNAVQED